MSAIDLDAVRVTLAELASTLDGIEGMEDPTAVTHRQSRNAAYANISRELQYAKHLAERAGVQLMDEFHELRVTDRIRPNSGSTE